MYKLNISNEKLFSINLTKDLFIALLSLLLMWLSFYIMSHTDNLLIKGVVFSLLTNIGINVLLPLFWCIIYKKESIEILGLTKKNLLLSLIVGFALAYIKFYQLVPLLSGINWFTNIFSNIFIFWEPFFIFGWLQSRFEKSFGIIGGIILAGLSLGIYHIGSFPIENVLILAANGVVFALVYRITRNLLIMWPAFWSISATVGTLSGGFNFGFEFCLINFTIFIIQVLIIKIIINKNSNSLAS